MRHRFLVIVGQEQPPFLDRAVKRENLQQIFSGADVAAYVNGHCRHLPAGDELCVLGTLFPRHGPARPVAALAPADARRVVESAGAHLIDSYWGGYVAVLAGQSAVTIMRDPSAALPCYAAQGQGYAAFASDAELLVEAGAASIELDWSALAAHFYSSGVPSAATALSGICELLPGFAVSLPGGLERQWPCWSPWDHAEPREAEVGPADEGLARTVKHCIASWASAHGRLLASVSGGLDSSIVAAALAAARADAACLTMYGDDPSGDERPYARALCGHLGLPLVERAYDLSAIDIRRAMGTHLPRPTDRTQALEYERSHLEVAREIGASAFITGNGGDSVFGYSQSAAAAADRLLREGPGRGLLRTLADISRQTGCGVPKAAASALRIARGPRAYRCRPEPLLLAGDVVAALRDTLETHPWLAAPPGGLPGKAAHIASILRVLPCMEAGRSRYLPVINPLMSQPVVEACLAIPSWDWRSGGRDRAAARRAFSRDLPTQILARRVKGGPDSFAAQIVGKYRVDIRERLLNGQLAAHGIVDKAALERILSKEVQLTGEARARILEFLAAEAWIDSWRGRAQGAAASMR